jgi:2-polyprenyl-3-methyl-5-hydroxy-6-metoxy-1,4-benzoquinol methylase
LIPFYLITQEGRRRGGRPETALAMEMGEPPWGWSPLPRSATVGDLLRETESGLLGLTFDPEFWYGKSCWRRWLEALAHEGTSGKINVPLGNQDSAWRTGMAVPPYMTLRGIEKASEFVGPVRWSVKLCPRPEGFMVAVVPRSVLEAVPVDFVLADLPIHWAREGQEVRIFCEGWLHAFNVIEEAGRRPDLLSMCDWQGQILELGCSSGLMAVACKEMGSRVFWVGIDLDPDSLKRARASVDLCIQADITQPPPLSQKIKFDRIVCGDVLEHLPYPCRFLKNIQQWMKPEGFLVASFPNVGHWSIVEDLMAGRWDETPSGTLCVTHLRFGTRRTWARWLQAAGWEVIRWESEKVPLPVGWHTCLGGSAGDQDLEGLETYRYRVLARTS